uniref:Enoyl reductase (ER) domain-containing protein n=1 Tax=Zooxanthella nutricula TaxID=1333877 RepID=A0A7S2PKE6_9DINO
MASTMMGTTFLGVRSEANPVGYAWRQRPMPRLQHPTDILARVHKTTICGTDLHILGGNVPQAKVGLGLGHEGIVDILEVGSEVKRFKVGDRVLCCCISACGTCKKCKDRWFGNCEAAEGSWSLGHLIDGFQAEYVRVPHADLSCYALPASCPRDSPEEDKYLMLADILPTSYEIGLVDGDMADGKTCAIVGVGPVGLAALLAACSMYKAKAIIAIDLDEGRLELATRFGATHTVCPPKGDGAPAAVRDEVLRLLGDGEDGVDVVVEAVGLPGGWYIAQEIVKPGGNVAILGVHGRPVTLNLERMWYRNFKLTAGMVHGYSIPRLMEKVEDGSLRADLLISHHWKLSQIEDAYAKFESRRDGALKMLLCNDRPGQAPKANSPNVV